MNAAREAALRALAAEGGTLSEMARQIGVRVPTLSHQAKKLGLTFKHGRPKGLVKTIDPRSEEMAALYRGGKTLQQIGDLYGFSRERARQIMTKYHGIRYRDGGAHATAAQHRVERLAKRDARYLARHGCTWAQYQSLSGKPRRVFTHQRINAKKRGIEWCLTIWQWWAIWQESGHWLQRGRGQGYGMCRKGDLGPYAVDNVFIAPCFVNSREQPRWRAVALPIGVRQRKTGFIATRKIRGNQIVVGPFPTVSQAAAAYWTAGAAA